MVRRTESTWLPVVCTASSQSPDGGRSMIMPQTGKLGAPGASFITQPGARMLCPSIT